jgi:Putative peptidoglycan binding domain
MRLGRFLFASSLLMTMTVSALAMTHARRGPTSQKLFGKRKPAAKPASQHSIDKSRASEIQNALVKSGYLSGEPSGVWDTPTQSAMQKLQADNGWQTKLVPDSRAIIKLGLGPQQDTIAQGQ